MVYNMLTEDQWAEQERKDPEQGIGHNKDLYTVWNEKPNFLKIVAENNFQLLLLSVAGYRSRQT